MSYFLYKVALNYLVRVNPIYLVYMVNRLRMVDLQVKSKFPCSTMKKFLKQKFLWMQTNMLWHSMLIVQVHLSHGTAI